jgi:hypothetical protein
MTNILHLSSIYTGRGFWGMQSDGFCRISTRAGSAPVVKRNWHWGPLVHQTHADSYGLLFSRAVRLAIDDLVAGRIPPEPPSIDDYERILDETVVDEKTPVHKKCEWKSRRTLNCCCIISYLTFETDLLADMASDEYAKEGISGVHCAIGTANQVRICSYGNITLYLLLPLFNVNTILFSF